MTIVLRLKSLANGDEEKQAALIELLYAAVEIEIAAERNVLPNLVISQDSRRILKALISPENTITEEIRTVVILAVRVDSISSQDGGFSFVDPDTRGEPFMPLG